MHARSLAPREPRPRRGLALSILLLSILPTPARALDAQEAATTIFVDRAVESGIDFEHFNGMSGEYYFAENMGSGAALVDFDNDGDLDVYLVQGRMLGPDRALATATFAPRHALPLTDRLYRNDTAVVDGSRSLRFVDVTEASGLTAANYGMGVAVGDYDNDGWSDLYITAYGANRMLHNEGDGTFSDTTAVSGTAEHRWSVSATFLDFDQDGWLDLYVGNYVDFSLRDPPCTTATGTRDYCAPLAYDPEPDRLFRNRGDGTFEDFTVRAGVQGTLGGALGVATADFNGDGWTDIYVANDMSPNLLWVANPDGGFTNEALFAGCAVNWEGLPEASMGVDVADIDGDGDEDLFMTHITGESNTLFLNDGQGGFLDATLPAGLGNPSANFTAFGTAWIDYDNDSQLDLLVVNGAVKAIPALVLAGDPYPVHQPNQLFHNRGDGTFEEMGETTGRVFQLSEVSRGAAFGDIDNDGDTDALISNNAGPARLLINQVGQDHSWSALRLLLRQAPRPALGARVSFSAEGTTLWRRVRRDGSYASANDPRILAGLGERGVGRIRVHWPSGRVSDFSELPSRTVVTIAELSSGGTP